MCMGNTNTAVGRSLVFANLFYGRAFMLISCSYSLQGYRKPVSVSTSMVFDFHN